MGFRKAFSKQDNVSTFKHRNSRFVFAKYALASPMRYFDQKNYGNIFTVNRKT